MTFNSIEFLIFLPIVLLVYFLLPHKIRWFWLLAASYYAYMSWNPWLIFLILATTVVSYLAALLIEKSQSKRMKKLWLIVTLTVCLGILTFFKYFNFLLENAINILNLFTLDIDSVAMDIILPIGISFYTFQTLSYVIDVYRGTIKAERHFGYYALFVSYFPQLVAGPIERPENLLPQLKAKHRLNTEDLSVGFRIMLVGFFRKCVVADFCGIFVDNVFNNLGNANALAILAAGCLFIVQVYCDFAGYSEIAMGAARMMGVKLMRNFDKPFSATSIRDLMRRWHISLNTWFRDYVYIPLGGSKKGKLRRFCNVMIVYFLCGLWHGANWTFVFWGLYVGLFLVIEGWLRKPYHKLCEKFSIDNTKAWIVWVRRCIAFLVFVPSGIFFRAQSLAQIGELFVQFFTTFGVGQAYFDATLFVLGMSVLDMIQLGMCLLCLCLVHDMSEFGGKKKATPLQSGSLERSLYAQRMSSYLYCILAVALAWLILLAEDNVSAFVYFQF